MILMNHTQAATESPIKTDEVVTFLPTVGYPIEQNQQWQLHIHGWIYEPEWTSDLSIIARTLFGLEEYHLPNSNEQQEIFENRTKPFFFDNEGGKTISIQLGKENFVLNESGNNGHFETELRLSEAEINQLRQQDTIHFTAITRPKDDRQFSGIIYLMEKTGFSIISDIDDTIKISEVHDKSALLANTFLRPFRAVPGMADLYQAWANTPHTTFHYVSASPWQLYFPLAHFIKKQHFPEGSIHLRLFRLKDSSLFNFLSSSKPHKLDNIRRLIEHAPQRHFILVGDSGESDPEIYAEIARQYPDNIAHIFIREVPRKTPRQETYAEVFKGIPNELITIFTDINTLEKDLQQFNR